MKLVKPHPQIFLFLGDSPADLGSAFVRLQEFYESPSKLFRGKYFTLAKFKAWYKRTQSRTGHFTYYSDYFGYNVPGDVFTDWAVAYAGRETEDEQRLLTALGPLPELFYIIGAPKDSAQTIDHELSHAFFHLFPNYRSVMKVMQDGQDLEGIRKYLKANMYAPDVFEDEIASYVMFDWPLMNRAGVRTRHLSALKNAMLNVYKEYKRRVVSF